MNDSQESLKKHLKVDGDDRSNQAQVSINLDLVINQKTIPKSPAKHEHEPQDVNNSHINHTTKQIKNKNDSIQFKSNNNHQQNTLSQISHSNHQNNSPLISNTQTCLQHVNTNNNFDNFNDQSTKSKQNRNDKKEQNTHRLTSLNGSKNNTQHNPAVNNDNQFECRRHSLTGQNASNIDNSNANKDETHPPTSISNLDHNPGKPKSFSSTVLKLFDGHCETIDSQQNESSSVPNQIELNKEIERLNQLLVEKDCMINELKEKLESTTQELEDQIEHNDIHLSKISELKKQITNRKSQEEIESRDTSLELTVLELDKVNKKLKIITTENQQKDETIDKLNSTITDLENELRAIKDITNDDMLADEKKLVESLAKEQNQLSRDLFGNSLIFSSSEVDQKMPKHSHSLKKGIRESHFKSYDQIEYEYSIIERDQKTFLIKKRKHTLKNAKQTQTHSKHPKSIIKVGLSNKSHDCMEHQIIKNDSLNKKKSQTKLNSPSVESNHCQNNNNDKSIEVNNKSQQHENDLLNKYNELLNQINVERNKNDFLLKENVKLKKENSMIKNDFAEFQEKAKHKIQLLKSQIEQIKPQKESHHKQPERQATPYQDLSLVESQDIKIDNLQNEIEELKKNLVNEIKSKNKINNDAIVLAQIAKKQKEEIRQLYQLFVLYCPSIESENSKKQINLSQLATVFIKNFTKIILIKQQNVYLNYLDQIRLKIKEIDEKLNSRLHPVNK